MYDGLRNLEVPGDRKFGGFKRGLKALALFLALAIGIYGGYGVYTYLNLKNKIGKGVDEQITDITRSLPNEPINILLLGSDRRDVVEADARGDREFRGGGGQRADTIVLLHLSPKDKKNAVIVSFPRDLRVRVPGHGNRKINSAYQLGGPNLMINTVKELTGLDVHHYVEVNFASFQAMVDAVDGVSLYIPRPLEDPKAGLRIEQTGCVPLDGRTALALVRSRNIYPTADFGRIQTQQRFMRALLRKVKSLGFLLNLKKVNDLGNTLSQKLRYDKNVTLDLARAIATQLSSIGEGGVDFRVAPNRCCTRIGGQSYVMYNRQEGEEFFTALKNDIPLPDYGKTGQSAATPKDVTVRVLNASGVNGLAATHVQRLRKLGYRATVGGTADRRLVQTAIRFTVDSEQKARLLKREYPTANVVVAERSQSVDVVLYLGKDIATPSTASPSAKPAPAKTQPPEEKPLLGACDG